MMKMEAKTMKKWITSTMQDDNVFETSAKRGCASKAWRAEYRSAGGAKGKRRAERVYNMLKRALK